MTMSECDRKRETDCHFLCVCVFKPNWYMNENPNEHTHYDLRKYTFV